MKKIIKDLPWNTREGTIFTPRNCGESFPGEMTIGILNDKQVLRVVVTVVINRDAKTLAYM